MVQTNPQQSLQYLQPINIIAMIHYDSPTEQLTIAPKLLMIATLKEVIIRSGTRPCQFYPEQKTLSKLYFDNALWYPKKKLTVP